MISQRKDFRKSWLDVLRKIFEEGQVSAIVGELELNALVYHFPGSEHCGGELNYLINS